MRRTLLIAAFVMLFVCSSAFSARPVARWDTVPHQLLDQPINVGVVAVHLSGVEVQFSVNSTVVHTAAAPTYNPRTDVWEYVLNLDPASYADGLLTVDAKAIALSGDKITDPDYDLPSLTLYANTGGTLTAAVEKWADSVNGSDSNPGTEAAPYATLAKAVSNTPAGGTVSLLPGHYSSQSLGGGTRPYWTTIRPADGITRDQVIIDGGGRPSTQYLKFQEVSFLWNYTGTYGNLLVGDNGSKWVWVDNCYFENLAGRWGGNLNYFGNKYYAYVTGGEGHGMANGPGGSIIRDHHLYSLRSDAWSGGGKLVVNCSVTDIDPGSTGAHPDFHQSYTTAPNFVSDVILYNVRGYDCKSQGLFGSRLKDAAFINVLIEHASGHSSNSQYSGPMINVLFAHISLIRQTWLWRGSDSNAYDPTDVNVINNIFGNMSYYEDAAPDPELFIDYNHFSGNTQGTNITTGDPMYLDGDNKDYRIDPTSPAVGNGLYLQCVPADIDGNLYDPAGRNRGCYAASANIDRIPGDAEEDGDVDIFDFLRLKANYGTQSGATWQQGDFDGDGDVDIFDFLILKANYGA